MSYDRLISSNIKDKLHWYTSEFCNAPPFLSEKTSQVLSSDVGALSKIIIKLGDNTVLLAMPLYFIH
jgi:hypothetical protein